MHNNTRAVETIHTGAQKFGFSSPSLGCTIRLPGRRRGLIYYILFKSLPLVLAPLRGRVCTRRNYETFLYGLRARGYKAVTLNFRLHPLARKRPPDIIVHHIIHTYIVLFKTILFDIVFSFVPYFCQILPTYVHLV